MKNTMIWQIGEFFCPHSCLCCGKTGGILCECCEKYIMDGKNVGCLKCGNALEDGVCKICALPFKQQFCLGFREGLLKDLVSLFKYRGVRAGGIELARLFKLKFGELDDDLVIVPLPTIRKHIRERGFDHTYKLAR